MYGNVGCFSKSAAMNCAPNNGVVKSYKSYKTDFTSFYKSGCYTSVTIWMLQYFYHLDFAVV